MQAYEQQAMRELKTWQRKMSRRPGFLNKLSKKMQTKLNSYIPDKVHKAITTTVKQMVRGVLFGAQYVTKETETYTSLEVVEARVKEKISFYKTTAATEGGLTGAAGIL